MKAVYAGAIAIIIAAILWAIDGLFLTPQLYELNVLAVVFALHVIGFLIMSTFMYKYKKEFFKLKKKEWIATFCVGLFGGVLGTFAITKAIFLVFVEGASISVVLLLQKLQPLFAIALAIYLLKEKPTKRYFLWLALALVGSYFLTFGATRPELSWSNPTIKAALFALLAAASWGASTSISKYAFKKVSYITSTYLRYATTTIIAGLILLIIGKALSLGTFSSKNWLIVLIITLSTGGGAILIYYWGLARVKASAATIYELAMPVTALFLEFIFTGKLLTWTQGIGAIILTGSIIFLIREKKAFRHIKGKVCSGKKKGSQFVKIYKTEIIKQIGFKPFHGTLNLKVEKEIKARTLQTIAGFTKNKVKYGRVDYTLGSINGYPCAILLPRKTTHKDTIEIIADTNLRKKLKLHDEKDVKIEY